MVKVIYFPNLMKTSVNNYCIKSYLLYDFYLKNQKVVTVLKVIYYMTFI